MIIFGIDILWVDKFEFDGRNISMIKYRILKIQEQPEVRERFANWFHKRWNIPLEAYLESIDECLKNENDIPQW